MLRKLSVIAAILAALAIPGAALAKHGGGHGGHGHMGGRGHVQLHVGHGNGNWNRHNNWKHNNNWNRWHGNNGHWRGHGRSWRGHWYAYGVGSCWRVAPGGWVWVCN